MTAPGDHPSTGQQISFPPNVRISVVSEDLPADAAHRRWRATVLFAIALAMFTTSFGVALWYAFIGPIPDPETRRDAIGILVTLIGALAGFLGGRAAK